MQLAQNACIGVPATPAGALVLRGKTDGVWVGDVGWELQLHK